MGDIDGTRIATTVNWMRTDEARAHPMMATFVPIVTFGDNYRALLEENALPHVVRVPINGASIVSTAQRVLGLEGIVGRWTLYYEGVSEDGDECLIAAFDNHVDAALARLTLS